MLVMWVLVAAKWAFTIFTDDYMLFWNLLTWPKVYARARAHTHHTHKHMYKHTHARTRMYKAQSNTEEESYY